jgi:hypothetical protein
VSASLEARLSAQRHTILPLNVKVANGGLLQYTQELQNCVCWTQGYHFYTNFKILPLGYDIILGYDWLNQHSPMTIDWSAQTMSFVGLDRQVSLCGVQPDMTKCPTMSADQLQSLLRKGKISRVVQLCLLKPDTTQPAETLPAPAKQLLHEFEVLFLEPTELPLMLAVVLYFHRPVGNPKRKV